MNRFRPAEILVIACVAWSLHAVAAGDAPAPGASGSPAPSASGSCPPHTDPELRRHLDLSEVSGGNYCDDSYPLPLAAQNPAAPAVPDVCSGQTARNGETPWQQGFREALSGQRHVVSMDIGGVPADMPHQDRSPFRADRTACAQYQDGSRERELQCCVSAYWKGLPILRNRMQQLQASSANGSPEELLCLDEYRRGFNQGHALCTGPDQCALPQATRYLACYHLGRAVATAQACHDPAGDRIRERLRTQGVVYDGAGSKSDGSGGAGGLDPASGGAI